MAYNRNALTLNTAAQTPGSSTVWSYYTTTDSISTILAPNYFQRQTDYPSVNQILNNPKAGDRIIISDASNYTYEVSLVFTPSGVSGIPDTVTCVASSPCVLQTNIPLDYSGANTVMFDIPMAGYLYAFQMILNSNFTGGSLSLEIRKGAGGTILGTQVSLPGDLGIYPIAITADYTQRLFTRRLSVSTDSLRYNLINNVSGAGNLVSVKVNAYLIPVSLPASLS